MPIKRAGSADVSAQEMLAANLGNVTEAGNELAEAAHRVQADFDGIHRLRAALANWYRVLSNESGRGV